MSELTYSQARAAGREGRTKKRQLISAFLMIKLVYCITRRPDLSPAEFYRYWRDVHGPIGAAIPGVKRLVQSPRLEVRGDAPAGDFDGMVELWFDSIETLLQARQSKEWRRSAADEENFIDHSKVAYFVTEEREVPIKGTRSTTAR